MSNGNYTKDMSAVWDEYKYRHDLVWRKVHQFTIIMVTLGIIPHLKNDDVTVLGRFLIPFLPVLGVAFGIFGIFVLKNEMKLLSKIKTAYRRIQNKVLKEISIQPDGSKIELPFHDAETIAGKKHFEWYLWIYYCSILGFTYINAILIFANRS